MKTPLVNFKVVIPARYASSRLPGKVLLRAKGKTIIQHVYENACASDAGQIIIATDDQRIVDCARSFNAEVQLTSNAHKSGTDRIAEVARTCSWDDAVIIVNVQGDEPMVSFANINQVAGNLLDRPDVGMSTLCAPFSRIEEYNDPNVVKVLCDENGIATTFTRNLNADWKHCNARRHLGIYAYRVGFLHQFTRLPRSPLEKRESLEQLRALEQGEPILVDVCESPVGPGVDTREDYINLLKIM